MSDTILYVRSKEISVGGSPELSGHHGYASTYRGSSGPNLNYYEPQDQEAINLMEKNKMVYTLVDLTKSPLALRLRAKLSGLKTPTVIWYRKKAVGVESIKRLLGEEGIE